MASRSRSRLRAMRSRSWSIAACAGSLRSTFSTSRLEHSMTAVRLNNVDVHIPIYDSHSRRLIRLPSFGFAKVGSQAISHSGSVLIIHALSGLNLDLAEGDRVCLIGHNGAGKTTLLRLVAGIYPPTGGSVEIFGKVFALLGNIMMMNPD